jgi:hypothetical protein
MKKIYYIGYYSGLENPNDFYEFPSSNSKMEYIISVIGRLNFNLTVFSLGFPKSYSSFFKKRRTIHVDQNTDFVFVSTISLFFPFLSFISKIGLYYQVFNLLLFKVKKEDIVLVYHSYLLNKVVNFCRVLSKFKLVYEVEEIYQAAWQNSSDKIEKEIKSLRNADGYILVNDIMSERLHLKNKPFVVCYGSYMQKETTDDFIDNVNINLVYAGFIAGEGSDVELAIDTIDLLPDNYFLNVLGYGNQENIQKMKDKIELVNAKIGKEKVKYFGCLTGKEYDRFLSKCDIGLSTRVLVDEYSDFTFPSKVLVYLSNNLVPVSSKINCILESKIVKSVIFYDENSPESVVKAVLSADMHKFHSENKSLINNLDTKFVEDFNKMLVNDIN